MTLPVSPNPISLSQVNVELGRSATAAISMNDSAVRTLFGAGGSGTGISMSSGRGKSNKFIKSIVGDQANLNLRTWALANGWDGTVEAIIEVPTNTYVYSTSTGSAGLIINGSWPGGVTVINNGYIMGMGGAGGYVINATAAYAGGNGGPAISLGVSCSITNNSYIGGGGGGGGSHALNALWDSCPGGGGGAGGGAGGYVTYGGTASGGAGGSVRNSGGNASGYIQAGYYVPSTGGGGGGRIMPGTGGSPFILALGNLYGGGGGGAGGAGGGSVGYGPTAYPGGSGGGGGAAGAATSNLSGGGGGGWGAAGGRPNGAGIGLSGEYGTVGGSGGQCVALNGYSVTWNATGTRYGAIS